MSDCTPVGMPMAPGAVLTRDQCPSTPEEQEEMSNIPYMSAVGSLMYLVTMSCPDIAYTVGVLACFNSNPGMTQWKAVKHLF